MPSDYTNHYPTSNELSAKYEKLLGISDSGSFKSKMYACLMALYGDAQLVEDAYATILEDAFTVRQEATPESILDQGGIQ